MSSSRGRPVHILCQADPGREGFSPCAAAEVRRVGIDAHIARLRSFVRHELLVQPLHKRYSRSANLHRRSSSARSTAWRYLVLVDTRGRGRADCLRPDVPAAHRALGATTLSVPARPRAHAAVQRGETGGGFTDPNLTNCGRLAPGHVAPGGCRLAGGRGKPASPSPDSPVVAARRCWAARQSASALPLTSSARSRTRMLRTTGLLRQAKHPLSELPRVVRNPG